MTVPAHHAPDSMLAAYAAGALPFPFEVILAAHVSLCDECRARLGAHQLVGGLVLDGLGPESLSTDARDRALAALGSGSENLEPSRPEGVAAYPVPISGLVGVNGPRWRSLGFGAKQAILWSGAAGSLRLLSIPAAQAVPEHGHRGLELTLVLSGAFADVTGLFKAADLEVADEDVGHTPRATEDGPCVCVAATDAPLRFRAFVPRLLQPMFRI
jgi:putative transcriptional regulator